MPPNSRKILAALLLVLLANGRLLAQPSREPAGDIDAARQAAIEAAHDTRLHTQAVALLRHDIDVRGREAGGAQRGLDDTKPQQVRFLGTLLTLPSDPAGASMFNGEQPLDRSRSEMLAAATLPALRAEGEALASEIKRLAALHRDIDLETTKLAADSSALEQDQTQLASAIARRHELEQKALPEDVAGSLALMRLGRDAKDVAELIKSADAATERRDKEILTRAQKSASKGAAATVTAATADPTRPHELRRFDPPETLMVPPVAGPITRAFESPDATGELHNALGLNTAPDEPVLAPFDGRVIYAAPFRDQGLVLIIRHGDAYYSLFAGLSRVDVRAFDWVLAGEPIGAMPGAAGASDKTPGTILNFEVRRDGHPVDPQPWLAAIAPEAAQGPGGDERTDRKGHE